MKPATGSRHPRRLRGTDPRRGFVRRSFAFAPTLAAPLGFGLRRRRPRNRRVSCICRPHHQRLGSIGTGHVLLRTGLHRARHAGLRQDRLIVGGRVRRGARSRGHQPPFLEIPPMELGRESMRAPPCRTLLRVSQQGSLDELLLGQHGLLIGTRRSRTSVEVPDRRGSDGRGIGTEARTSWPPSRTPGARGVEVVADSQLADRHSQPRDLVADGLREDER